MRFMHTASSLFETEHHISHTNQIELKIATLGPYSYLLDFNSSFFTISRCKTTQTQVRA